MIKNIFVISFLIFSGFLWSNEIAKLETDTVRLDEVIVTGSKNRVSLNTVPMSVSIVSEKMLQERFEPSVLPILTEEIPGLFITQRGVMGYGVAGGAAGGINIRGIGGAPTAGVLVLVNGNPQYMGIMGHPLADSYQSLIAERIEVVRGPASMLYGSNAMGGVVNIITKKEKEEGIKNSARLMYGSYNTLSAEYSGNVKEKEVYANWGLSYNRSEGHRENMDFSQINSFGKFGYDISQNWTSFIDLNLSKTLSSNPGSISRLLIDNDADVLRGLASLTFENEYDNSSGAMKFYYNFGTHKINDGYALNATPPAHRFYSEDMMLGSSIHQTYKFFNGNRTTFGFDYQRFGGLAENIFPDRKVELIHLYYNNFAGYVNVQQSFWNHKMTANAGIRLDHHQTKGSEWIPQLGLSYIPIQSSVFKAIVSKGFRNPTLRELYMFPPHNPDLLAERVMSYEVSYAQSLIENRLEFDVNLFHLIGENIIQTLPVEGRPLNVNTRKIENTGAEFQIKYRPSIKWIISGNYSFLNMKNKLIGAPEHKLHIGSTYADKKWTISSGLQLIGGLYTSLGQNVEKTDFILWNVRSSYHLFENVKVFVKGENLLNQQYEINTGFPMPGISFFGGVDLRF